MIAGTYQLFSDAGFAIGRLLTLQRQYTLVHLTRRLVEARGERSTFQRAGQFVVRFIFQWGVLRDADSHGE